MCRETTASGRFRHGEHRIPEVAPQRSLVRRRCRRTDRAAKPEPAGTQWCRVDQTASSCPHSRWPSLAQRPRTRDVEREPSAISPENKRMSGNEGADCRRRPRSAKEELRSNGTRKITVLIANRTSVEGNLPRLALDRQRITLFAGRQLPPQRWPSRLVAHGRIRQNDSV